MKKVFTLIFFLSTLYQTYAQVVSAPVLEGFVQEQTRTQQTQSNQILEELKSINNNLKENKKIQEEIKNIKTREEEDLIRVPSHVKNGTTMNSIIDTEGKILKMIKNLIDISNNSSFKKSDIDNFVNPIMKLTSSNVDDAIKLCTDNIYRMQPNERIRKLENINDVLNNLKNKLTSKVYEYDSFLTAEKEDIKNKQRFEEMKRKKIVINKQQL